MKFVARGGGVDPHSGELPTVFKTGAGAVRHHRAYLAGPAGFGPTPHDPKSRVLPLHHRPVWWPVKDSNLQTYRF